MTGKLEDSQADIDSTDELPVLSEDVLVTLDREIGSVDAPGDDPLAAAVDTLRDALERAETRWAGLKALYVPELTDYVVERPVPDRRQEAAAGTAAPTRQAASRSERALLERIAALESYIAGRADHWQAMEDELAARAARIDELEQELAQRVDRERNLVERLHDEGDKLRELRDRLRRMTRRLETVEQESVAPRSDETREMAIKARAPAAPLPFAPVAPVAPVAAESAVAAEPAATPEGPALIGISADVPPCTALDRDPLSIGRSAECDIVIGTHSVSRRHATIRQSDGRFVIQDEGSLNGVFVNGERVDRRELEPGDSVTIGESQFRYIGGARGESSYSPR